MEVLKHPFLTTKSTFTTIPSTKPTTSAVSEVSPYYIIGGNGCYDITHLHQPCMAYKSCPTSKDDKLCAKGSFARLCCPESCGLCKENGLPHPYPPNATCHDTNLRSFNCLHWKDTGICDDPQSPWYRYRRAWCAYTCGVC
uniref:ShKT domain-containing protein n=1 Tax=Acrobeloides nanus TaxID=290746 RepID=A0A914CKU4_9BILA